MCRNFNCQHGCPCKSAKDTDKLVHIQALTNYALRQFKLSQNAAMQFAENLYKAGWRKENVG